MLYYLTFETAEGYEEMTTEASCFEDAVEQAKEILKCRIRYVKILSVMQA